MDQPSLRHAEERALLFAKLGVYREAELSKRWVTCDDVAESRSR